MWDLNQGTLCKALESEKNCQDQPKMTVKYQQGFSEESERDALLDKKILTAHVFFDSQGKVERMETALLNGTVLKSTLEKKIMTENDEPDRHGNTSPKVAETRL